jgi:hypothetical protein
MVVWVGCVGDGDDVSHPRMQVGREDPEWDSDMSHPGTREGMATMCPIPEQHM